MVSVSGLLLPLQYVRANCRAVASWLAGYFIPMEEYDDEDDDDDDEHDHSDVLAQQYGLPRVRDASLPCFLPTNLKRLLYQGSLDS